MNDILLVLACLSSVIRCRAWSFDAHILEYAPLLLPRTSRLPKQILRNQSLTAKRGNIWLKRTHLRFVLIFYRIVRELSNIVWLSLPIIADCVCTLNRWEPQFSTEKNSIFSLTPFLHYAVFNVRARKTRCSVHTALLQFTSFPLTCQLLFQVFSTSLLVPRAVLATAFISYQTSLPLSTDFFNF